MAVFVALLFLAAPYGRHSSSKFGPSVSARNSWILMETPSVVIFFLLFIQSGNYGLVQFYLLCLFEIHYINRGIIYPFRVRGGEASVLVTAFGHIYTTFNAFLNGLALFRLSPHDDSDIFSISFIVGMTMWVIGFALNLQSDSILRQLRKDKPTGYSIPFGGLFDYVTAPNYFAEIVEWTGWAIMTRSIAGTAFAITTFFNLAPRARTHHLWYKREFPNYPKNRKILIPWVW
eukprot:TRINITY_DN8474_c0_g1_i4.p1 TRINITY_DN8474_c0_g1~~TRINITY_DN8474_c0_g1_i4.p1  ORF type:complete len:232 (+),score=28.56 TRINITY_DN8474_c0_g1_i4:190-885(+)